MLKDELTLLKADGNSAHVQLLLRMVQDYTKHSPDHSLLCREEKAVCRQLYLRLLWCDHLTISFHGRSVALGENRAPL